MVSLFPAPEWSRDSNIYEVNLRQYTPQGSFRAFEEELPRLRDMGVEMLWFMPVTPISRLKRLGTLGSYYSCSDYFDTNPEFGSIEDFRSLVQAAHERGFKVLIDWVANHTGWDHQWTREHPDFYLRNEQGGFHDVHGWEDVIDLDYSNPALWQEMIRAMRFWIEAADIDGFRCDMAMLVPLEFWKEARTSLDRLKPLFWLAECEEIPYYQVFDAGYTWRFLHSMEAYWRKEKEMAGLLEDLAYYHREFLPSSLHLFFTSNHDENSHHGSEFERMGEAAKPFAVFCCTWNGIPLVYSGQEMPNRKRIRFFDRDPIQWSGEYELHGFYRTLLLLRKKNRALRGGDTNVSTRILNAGSRQHVLAYLREGYDNQVLVILNLSALPVDYSLPDPLAEGSFVNAFTGEIQEGARLRHLQLGAWDFRVYEKS